MCHFIILVVEGASDDAVEAIVKRHGRSCALAIDNSALRAAEKNAVQYVTCGHCDCGTLLGNSSPDVSPSTTRFVDRALREDQKLKGKGWSDAKIARRREQIETAEASTHEAGKIAAQDAAQDEAASWSALMAELLAQTEANRVGLLVHFFAGSLDSESFDVTRREVPLQTLAEALATMREDELVLVV